MEENGEVKEGSGQRKKNERWKSKKKEEIKMNRKS